MNNVMICIECNAVMELVDELEKGETLVEFYECPCCNSTGVHFHNGHTGTVSKTWTPRDNS